MILVLGSVSVRDRYIRVRPERSCYSSSSSFRVDKVVFNRDQYLKLIDLFLCCSVIAEKECSGKYKSHTWRH